MLEIVGLGKACEMADRNLEHAQKHLQTLRDRLHQGLEAQLENMRLNGHPQKRLPNTLSLSFKGLEANSQQPTATSHQPTANSQQPKDKG